MNTAERFTGRLVWRLDPLQPTLANERPDLVDAIARGRSAAELPALLSALFSMCGHAHRLTASRAVAAAQGCTEPMNEAQQRALQLETLREHLRRLWLDWPRLLSGADAGAPHGMLGLAHCPLMRPGAVGAAAAQAALDELRPWLEHHVFGQGLLAWLQAWERDGEQVLDAWSRDASTLPARMLALAQPIARDVHLACRPWQADAQELLALGERLAHWPSAARWPSWREQTAETGPWTRLHAPAMVASHAEPAHHSLWWRMASRLADVARLALPDSQTEHHGQHWLQAGAISLGADTGLAWTEMARGVLLHWVRLDGRSQAPPRVAACQVVSPTDWNFHPDGVVPQSLLAPGRQDLETRLRLIPVLAAAYDPCVPLAVLGADGSPVMSCPPVAQALAVGDKGSTCTS